MKRAYILLVFIVLLIFPIFAKADCNYDEQNKLNVLASNVNYTYKYKSDISIFDIVLYNVKDELYVKLNGDNYYPTNEQITIKNIDSDDIDGIGIYASNKTNCKGQQLLNLEVILPYYNIYSESNYCKRTDDDSYCSRFIPKLSIAENIAKKDAIENKEQIDKELEKYLNEKRKNKNIIKNIVVRVNNIFEKGNIILALIILILISLIIYGIKRYVKIKKIKF